MTVCPQLTWQRNAGQDGAILKFLCSVPVVDISFYSSTYFFDWNEKRIENLVVRGDIRDPKLPPPPVNGVPFKEKSKDKKSPPCS